MYSCGSTDPVLPVASRGCARLLCVRVYTAGNYTHILAAIKPTAIHNPSGEAAIRELARPALDVELTRAEGQS